MRGHVCPSQAAGRLKAVTAVAEPGGSFVQATSILGLWLPIPLCLSPPRPSSDAHVDQAQKADGQSDSRPHPPQAQAARSQAPLVWRLQVSS